MLGASFLIAGVARDIDVLWCFSQDMFPFKTPIKESQVRFIISFQVTCKKNTKRILRFLLLRTCWIIQQDPTKSIKKLWLDTIRKSVTYFLLPFLLRWYSFESSVLRQRREKIWFLTKRFIKTLILLYLIYLIFSLILLYYWWYFSNTYFHF